MKRFLIAVAIALMPLALATPTAASAAPLKLQPNVVAAWPTICFEFAFWKYCI